MANLFDDKNVVSSNFVKWDKVGKEVSGVYVEKKITNNNLRPGTHQTIYTLVQDDGSTINISGRGNNDPTVIPGLEAAKFGQYVGLKYLGDMEAKKGFNPAKIIRVYSEGVMKPEVLAEYNGVSSEEIPQM